MFRLGSKYLVINMSRHLMPFPLSLSLSRMLRGRITRHQVSKRLGMLVDGSKQTLASVYVSYVM